MITVSSPPPLLLAKRAKASLLSGGRSTLEGRKKKTRYKTQQVLIRIPPVSHNVRHVVSSLQGSANTSTCNRQHKNIANRDRQRSRHRPPPPPVPLPIRRAVGCTYCGTGCASSSATKRSSEKVGTSSSMWRTSSWSESPCVDVKRGIGSSSCTRIMSRMKSLHGANHGC